MSDDRQTHVVNVPPGARTHIRIEDAGADLDQQEFRAGWFRMHRAVVREEIWARLSSSAKAVLPPLADACDVNWVARIAYEQPRAFKGTRKNRGLVELSGLKRASVARGMRDLKRHGLIIVRRCGRGQSSGIYQLVPPLETHRSKGLTDETLNISRVRHSRLTDETLNVSPVRSSQYIDRPREVSETLPRDNSRVSRSRSAWGPGNSDPIPGAAAAAVFLRVKEITRDEAVSLANLAGGSVERATRAFDYASDLRRRGKLRGTMYGAMRAAIEHNYSLPAAVVTDRTAIQNAKRREAERRQELADFEAGERADREFIAKLQAMGAQERADLVDATLADLPETTARRISSRDPLKNRVLRACMWSHMQGRTHRSPKAALKTYAGAK